VGGFVGGFVGCLVGVCEGLGVVVGDCDVCEGLGVGPGVGDWLLLPDGEGVVDGPPFGEDEVLGEADLLADGHADGVAEA